MLHSDLANERDARDIFDADDDLGPLPKLLQRTDGELAQLHKRLAAEFQFPEFTDSETFVAVPMPGTDATNIDDRFPE